MFFTYTCESYFYFNIIYTLFVTIVDRLEQFEQRRCVSAVKMDLHRQSIPGTPNVGSDEGSGWISAGRVGGSVRKIFDWDSGIEELCGIVLGRRGTGNSEIEGTLQLLNFSTLGKIANVRVTLLIIILKMFIHLAGRSNGRRF